MFLLLLSTPSTPFISEALCYTAFKIVLTKETMLVLSVILHITFKTLKVLSLCMWVICTYSPSVVVCVPQDRLWNRRECMGSLSRRALGINPVERKEGNVTGVRGQLDYCVVTVRSDPTGLQSRDDSLPLSTFRRREHAFIFHMTTSLHGWQAITGKGKRTRCWVRWLQAKAVS